MKYCHKNYSNDLNKKYSYVFILNNFNYICRKIPFKLYCFNNILGRVELVQTYGLISDVNHKFYTHV